MNFYKHHIGDYAQATGHLSFVEDAAYSRLLRKYYAEEKPIPGDLKAAQRLVGARSRDEKEAVETVLNEFFQYDADANVWRNKRADEEIRIAREAELEADDRRANEKERQQRHRARRKELFAALREFDIIPKYDTPTDALEAMLSRVTGEDGNGDSNVTSRVTGVTGHALATANQTPDTRHQTPEDQKQEQSEARTEIPNAPPIGAGRACLLLRQAGCLRVNPSHPDLIAALSEGVTPEVLRDTYLEFPNATNPFKWAITTARSRRREGAQAIATGPPPKQRSPQISKTGMAVQALEAMKSENRLGNGRDSDGAPEAGLPRLGSTTGG